MGNAMRHPNQPDDLNVGPERTLREEIPVSRRAHRLRTFAELRRTIS